MCLSLWTIDKPTQCRWSWTQCTYDKESSMFSNRSTNGGCFLVFRFFDNCEAFIALFVFCPRNAMDLRRLLFCVTTLVVLSHALCVSLPGSATLPKSSKLVSHLRNRGNAKPSKHPQKKPVGCAFLRRRVGYHLAAHRRISAVDSEAYSYETENATLQVGYRDQVLPSQRRGRRRLPPPLRQRTVQLYRQICGAVSSSTSPVTSSLSSRRVTLPITQSPAQQCPNASGMRNANDAFIIHPLKLWPVEMTIVVTSSTSSEDTTIRNV